MTRFIILCIEMNDEENLVPFFFFKIPNKLFTYSNYYVSGVQYSKTNVRSSSSLRAIPAQTILISVPFVKRDRHQTRKEGPMQRQFGLSPVVRIQISFN